MKYFRNNNSVYDLEKEISLLKSKVKKMINAYCNNFYDNEMVDSNKVEAKRKNLLNNIDIKYGFQKQDGLYYNKNDFYIYATCGEIDIKEERRYGKLIKQAKTIEELVDMYIVKLADNGYAIYEKCWHDRLVGFVKYANENNAIFYASIWVDDNLVKVAKTNEKGELELL